MLSPRKTDPAWELADFILWTRTIKGTNPNAPLFSVVAEALQLDPSHQMFYTMFGALIERVARVGRIRNQYHQNSEISDAENADLISALSSINLYILPANLNSAWGSLPNRLSDGNIVALSTFSQLIRDAYPLRRIQETDVIEVCARIDAKYQEIDSDETIEPWIREVVCDSLLKLNWYVRFIRFFGHEVMFDGLLAVQEKAGRLAGRAENAKAKSSLFEVVNFIAVLATAYAAPDATYTATRHYLELFSPQQHVQQLLPSHEQRKEEPLSLASVSTPLLTGPKS